MSRNKRILSLLLVVVLVLSSTVAFGADKKPKTKVENPSILRVKELIKDFMDLDWDIDPQLKNVKGHRVEIIGRLEGAENFKGNTKVKVLVNNVVVNPKDGYFSRYMSTEKDTQVIIRVFVGKVERPDLKVILNLVEDETTDKDKAITAAKKAVNKIRDKELTLEDKPLVEEARKAVDLLKKVLGSPLPKEYSYMENIVKEAERVIKLLEETTLRWLTEPYIRSINERGRRVYGHIFIPNKLKDDINVKIDGKNYPLSDGIIDVVKKGTKEIVIEVFEGRKEIVELERTLRFITDKDAAKLVIDLIDAIPKTRLALEDREKINEARETYDNLTKDQRTLVNNIDKLLEAEKSMRTLEEKAISWRRAPENKGERNFYGSLEFEDILKDRISLYVNRTEIDLNDNGSFGAHVRGTSEVTFTVLLDGQIIEGLTRKAK